MTAVQRLANEFIRQVKNNERRDRGIGDSEMITTPSMARNDEWMGLRGG